jgi:hypothetical protein
MTDAPGFTVEVDQNIHLPAGGTRVDAILTVTATGEMTGPSASDGLEMIIVDCSASMTGEKIRSAQWATMAAINELRDGVSFTVIAGNHYAAQLYPPGGGTATADAGTRAEAAEHVRSLRAGGGTAIGNWLTLAAHTAAAHPGAIKHAILLTDGQNGESDHVFASALGQVQGAFTCDCRGVGTDWRVDELRRVASALLGTIDIVADPAHLAADFQAVMGAAMGKSVPDVVLRLWAPRGAGVRFVKQVSPTVEDLTGRRTDSGALRGDYPLGSWGAESREYHVQVELSPGAVGDEVLATRASLLRSGSDEVLGQALVRAVWTDDAALSSRISRGVAHYTGQAELAAAIQEGVAAHQSGDRSTATSRLGRAVALAAESGNADTAALLEEVVEVIDAPSGTVRLREKVTEEGVMTLDTRSTKTVRVRDSED